MKSMAFNFGKAVEDEIKKRVPDEVIAKHEIMLAEREKIKAETEKIKAEAEKIRAETELLRSQKYGKDRN